MTTINLYSFPHIYDYLFINLTIHILYLQVVNNAPKVLSINHPILFNAVSFILNFLYDAKKKGKENSKFNYLRSLSMCHE